MNKDFNIMSIDKNVFSGLRKKAEEQLKSFKLPQKEFSHTDIISLVNELKICQVELQMQNDELRDSQSKLEQSLKKYSDLFENAPNGYFILNNRAKIVNVNYTGSAMLGIDKDQLIGKPFSTFMEGTICQDHFYRHWNNVFDTETSQNVECNIRKKDGSIFPALIETIYIKDEEGNFKCFHSVISNISEQIKERRRMEEALEKEKEVNELKSRFISMASHEFRTPLGAILSSTYLLEKYNTPESAEKRQKHLNKIKNAVQNLNETLFDFLSLSQIEKGTIKNNPETFNLNKFAEGIIEEIKSNNPNFTFIFSHKGDRKEVFLDKKLFKVCLTNLLGNAIKYSPSGGKIELITDYLNSKKTLTCSVKDYGIGIPDSDKDHIFEQFFRAKNVNSIQGTGLGLNIIKKLVTLMGGTINFKSKVGKGSVFTMEFFEF